MSIQLTYKAFTQETLPDVLTLVRSRFGEEGCQIARRLLCNPFLAEGGGSAGDIAYRDGRPICFMSTMVRRAYLGQSPVLCSVGGLFCKAVRGCPLSATIEIMQREGGARYRCLFGFGNTASANARGVNKEIGGVYGPETWCRSRFCLIHTLGTAWGVVKRKILRRPPPVWQKDDVKEVDDTVFLKSDVGVEVIRLKSIEPKIFDSFWNQYIASNLGFVVSRSSDELNWIFGDRIKDGRCVLLGAFNHGMLQGWIIIAPFKVSPRRWVIVDWISLNNDKETLSALLKAAVRFLKAKTNAWMFETKGFPLWSEHLIRKTFPFAIRYKGNPFFYFPQDNVISDRICMALDKEDGWFFGPYDGDMCL